MTIHEIDEKLISFFKVTSEPMARIAIFVVYFWFGILKVFDASPASPLVQQLFEKTMGGLMPFGTFMILFGIFEMIIGILFLIKGFERTVILLLAIHMVTTFMPLFMVPAATWTRFLVPTLEGQYIIKNLLIIAAAMGIAAGLVPLRIKRAY